MDENIQIIPYYAHPHVHTVIYDNTQYDETVASPDVAEDLPYSTCVVTGADKGIDNKFIKLSSFATKKALFGQGNYQKYGQSSLQADFTFNGSTNVWFCRVLPDDATYAHMILVAKYKKGTVANATANATELAQLQIKFEAKYAEFTQDGKTTGPKTESEIASVANTWKKSTADADGWMALPIAYVRSIGRGKYGNAYSISLDRDTDAEKEYGMKMYKWSLVENGTVSKIINIFSGSLFQTTRYNMSTLISDVIDQFETGLCPISIYPYEESIDKLYKFYQTEIVQYNETNFNSIASSYTSDQKTELEESIALAKAIEEEDFDPIFGYQLYGRSDADMLPFYKNYTNNGYVTPDKTGTKLPTYTAAATDSDNVWSGAAVGKTFLVKGDTVNKRYTVVSISDTAETVDGSGNYYYAIQWTETPVEEALDAADYDGIDIAKASGMSFKGGSDGKFETTNMAELKLYLAQEQVKAFKGDKKKDRAILSPSKIDLDFIFDANYNMTYEATITTSNSDIRAAYANATALTTDDYNNLTVPEDGVIDISDINVKEAIFNTVRFRNRNGMKVTTALGAGCSVYFDTGLLAVNSMDESSEIINVITAMENLTGRDCSVDIGYYEIFDPYTGKREKVTYTYKMASDLVNHIMINGLNVPWVYNYATLNALQRDNSYNAVNAMIKGSAKPDIDLIDWDAKELLYTNRINYWICSDEGRTVQRACQNTRALEASALLEENNVRVLNALKKGLDAACRSYLYNWNEPTMRKAFTDTQMNIYRPWIGTLVQDLNIVFDANEWEQERMIMHCYCEVKFRDIIKRIILQINIERPDYNTTTEGGE